MGSTDDNIDDLLINLENCVTISGRHSQYKTRCRQQTHQEERRKDLLQSQKEKRNELFNKNRHLNRGEKRKNDDGGDRWTIEKLCIQSEDDTTDLSSIYKVDWHKRAKYKDQLMLSEWLVDVPADFENSWMMVPCPVGKRSVVVSKCKRKASCYTKKGVEVCRFKSTLPARTILDCIWNRSTKSYYVLDVIQWSGVSLTECQTEFRFYWLKTKLDENPEISARSKENPFPVQLLPTFRCDREELSRSMTEFPMFGDNKPNLDGFLFYHEETHYTPGQTPLVGWLKGFMVLEVLGIPSAEQYQLERPSKYVTLRQYIVDLEEASKKGGVENDGEKDQTENGVVIYELENDMEEEESSKVSDVQEEAKMD